MLSNIAKIGNQPVRSPNLSVEKKTYKSDPFAIRDGRYVGSDGFVVPRDFEEFYQRFPDYVRNWVRKYANRSAPKEDLEDWTQGLLIHLHSLPQSSKYREAGKKDILQTFDPMKHHGANEARFRNYINLCLANKFRTIHWKLMKDALYRPGKLSLDGQADGEDARSVDDEYCHLHSAYLQTVAKSTQKQGIDKAFLREFVNFLRRQDPKVLPMIEALSVTGTQADSADFLGITESEFGRTQNRIRQLAACFLSGKPVPKQRRPYKKRVAKTIQFSGSDPIWTPGNGQPILERKN